VNSRLVARGGVVGLNSRIHRYPAESLDSYKRRAAPPGPRARPQEWPHRRASLAMDAVRTATGPRSASARFSATSTFTRSSDAIVVSTRTVRLTSCVRSRIGQARNSIESSGGSGGIRTRVLALRGLGPGLWSRVVRRGCYRRSPSCLWVVLRQPQAAEVVGQPNDAAYVSRERCAARPFNGRRCSRHSRTPR
jgi:hypothetical protein